MDIPRLSICIPTWQRANILRATLEHLATCGIAMEVVVTDNASPDDTGAAAQSYQGRFARFQYLRQTHNRGPQENCATSLSLATGDYVYTLSDDDRIIPGGIAAAMAVLDREPEVVAVYGGYQEWDPATDQVLSTNLHVRERKTYTPGQQAQLIQDYALLWCPLARREIVQRYCSYDKRSFGLMRFAGQLLRRGSIAVIPDLLYKHAHTPQRLENQLTESWYHDQHRADYELYLAEAFAHTDANQVSRFVAQRAAHGYLQAIRFARKQKQYVTAQQFVLRAKAYGLLTDDALLKWERDNLYHVLADRIAQLARGIPEVTVVVMEDCEEGRRCAAAMGDVDSDLTSRLVERAAIGLMLRDESVLLVARDYETVRHHSDPLRCRALLDLLAGCRVVMG